jgi:hypothetical protein
MRAFLILLDTPGIKQFVFGTDPLAEVRGASALLDRLNREETRRLLEEAFPGRVMEAYAAGGAAQFVVSAEDWQAVNNVLERLAALYAEQTGGEVQLLWGIGELAPDDPGGYRAALRAAFSDLAWRRFTAREQPTVLTFPLAVECQSTSYLPATRKRVWADEIRLVSEASDRKYREISEVNPGRLWAEFIHALDLPATVKQTPHWLRCTTLQEIGEYSESRAGYLGLVYADGNAMGRLVQELESLEVARAFSTLVDGSIRDACHQALKELFRETLAEIRIRCDPTSNYVQLRKIPGDILLLGGDDLVVVLPAELAVPFSIRLSELFEEYSGQRQEELEEPARRFFRQRLEGRGLTVSCGVVIAPSRFPFYLLLDLAEELLASAKKGGSRDPEATRYWVPSYIDFHIQAGSAVHDLHAIRREEYGVGTAYVRTFRPYRRDKLQTLCAAVAKLRRVGIPQSKRHDLLEAALEPRARQAEWKAKELFGRLAGPFGKQRLALFEGLCQLAPMDLNEFPWVRQNGVWATALADLMEIYDFVQAKEA